MSPADRIDRNTGRLAGEDEYIVELNVKRKRAGETDTVTHVVEHASSKKQAITKAWNLINAVTKEDNGDE